jgi:hypothetical protein
MRRAAAALVVVAGLAASGAAVGADHPANVQWEEYLPALPASSEIQPRGVPYCRRAKIVCIDTEIARLTRMQREFGCDHRGVFATTYLELTKQLREDLHAGGFKKRLMDRRFLYVEDALFANVYFQSVKDYRHGRPVPEAWQVAFDTARDGEVNGTQDMLLGINAHVQNDMPFVLAALGLVTRDGKSRKPDHDLINEVLERAYQRVIDAVSARYDPFVGSTSNSSATGADDAAGLELVKQWRENVWRNAERLVNAKSDDERRQIADEVHSYAGEWARNIARPQTPGDRARRDAYCASR